MKQVQGWIERISNEQWRETARLLAKLVGEIPALEAPFIDIIWLIYAEDARRKGGDKNGET